MLKGVKKVAIVGASGYVGTALSAKLEAAGVEVVKISRRKREGWCLFEKESFLGVDAVVNLAGESVDQRWTATAKEKILNSRVATTLLIAEWLGDINSEERPHVWLNASAVGFYGDRGNEELTETSDRGKGFLADVCSAWEDAVQPLEGVRQLKLRIGVVLGRDSRAWAKICLPFKYGVGGRLGSGKQWMPWVHISDLLEIICYALRNPEIEGVLNAVAPNPVTNLEFTEALGSEMGRPTFCAVPAFMMKLLLGEFSTAVLGSSRATPVAAQKHGFRFKFEKIEDCLADLVRG